MAAVKNTVNQLRVGPAKHFKKQSFFNSPKIFFSLRVSLITSLPFGDGVENLKLFVLYKININCFSDL